MDGTPAAPNPSQGILLSRLATGGQWERLLDASRSTLARDPGDARAHRYAAQALINLERHAEAEPHLGQVLSRNPNDDYAHRLLSIIHFARGRFRQADAEAHEAISLNPREPYHWYHLANMCYRQNDKAAALKWIAKARELRPNDPDFLNLQSLCTDSPEGKAVLLREALSRDPENALLHNNLGAYYLNRQDYPQAEECFRRALSLNPSLEIARRNLFNVLKRRDRIYRALRVPLDFILAIWRECSLRRQRKPILLILMILFWIMFARYLIIAIVLWFILLWPLLKAYEFLVVGDIRRVAGEIGARRGGFLGYRGWPLHLRLGLFAVFLIAFWSGVGRFVYEALKPDSHDVKSVPATILACVVGVALVVFILLFVRKMLRRAETRFHSWRRNRRFRNLNVKKP